MTTETQAAAPITSATEPAPANDETQAVYAWSNDSDDTELIRRRSWKLPLAAVIVAAAGLAAGITVWPHHSTLRNPAAPPQAAPHNSVAPKPAEPVDPNARFLAAYQKAGYKEEFPGQTFHLLDQARDICAAHQSGEAEPQLVEDMFNDFVGQGAANTDRTRLQAKMLVDTALNSMCPSR